METIRGKKSLVLDLHEWQDRLTNYQRITLDLGTGDGRYVRFLADRHPDWFVIGVDACRENLHRHSQARLPNMLFIIASALGLPSELHNLVSHLTINFPWGSLLDGLLAGDPGLMDGLWSATRPSAKLDLYLNGGALMEAGTTLEAGAEQIHANLLQAGWQLSAPVTLNAGALRNLPTTWAKRLAFGRDPRAIQLSCRKE